MKGLTLTILLAILEIGAVMSSPSSLLADSRGEASSQLAASRKEEAGIQSEVVVDAERPEIALTEPAAEAADAI